MGPPVWSLPVLLGVSRWTPPTITPNGGHPQGIDWRIEGHHGEGAAHYAERLTLMTAQGELAWPTQRLAAVPAPKLEHVVSWSSHDHVLLGWSSSGSGRQTNHAVIADDRAGVPTLGAMLTTTSSTQRARLYVRRPKLLVHVGVPCDPADEDWPGHIVVNGVRYATPTPGAHGCVSIHPEDRGLQVYAPPAHTQSSIGVPPGGVIWFAAIPSRGFVPLPVPAEPYTTGQTNGGHPPSTHQSTPTRSKTSPPGGPGGR